MHVKWQAALAFETPEVVGDLVARHFPQPALLLALHEVFEAGVFQGSQENLDKKIFRVAPGSSLAIAVGYDGRCLLFIEPRAEVMATVLC